MPRRNRGTPFGEVVAVPERGTFLGNRGLLHDEEGRLRRAWQVKRWILCLLEFKGRRRAIMSPGRYTELFFLDEATGMAAGHRPCAECRRGRYLAFRDTWVAGNPGVVGDGIPSAPEMDDRLHTERIGPDRAKRTFSAGLDVLPDGVLVTLEGRPGEALLVRGDALLAWSPGGYGERRPRPKGERVSVLTPRSIVGAIRAGYAPEVHPTAGPPLTAGR
jgi:hypothetical protein